MPLVYEELRRIAGAKMAAQSSEHTLQPTALVHEAWLRLGGPDQPRWQNRAHFFGAAAEAMRLVLVDHARRKLSLKRGGGFTRVELGELDFVLAVPEEKLLEVHEALDALALEEPTAAELVKLRYFVGLSMEECAIVLGMGKRTAEGLWTYARAWLRQRMREHS